MVGEEEAVKWRAQDSHNLGREYSVHQVRVADLETKYVIEFTLRSIN